MRPTQRGRGRVGEGVLTVASPPTGGAGILLAEAGLERRGASLLVAGVRLTEIAERAGTPVYVYNLAVIRQRYAALDAALAAVPHRICFAIKANANLGVLRALSGLGAGADIVSGGELARALAAYPGYVAGYRGLGLAYESFRAVPAHHAARSPHGERARDETNRVTCGNPQPQVPVLHVDFASLVEQTHVVQCAPRDHHRERVDLNVGLEDLAVDLARRRRRTTSS